MSLCMGGAPTSQDGPSSKELRARPCYAFFPGAGRFMNRSSNGTDELHYAAASLTRRRCSRKKWSQKRHAPAIIRSTGQFCRWAAPEPRSIAVETRVFDDDRET